MNLPKVRILWPHLQIQQELVINGKTDDPDEEGDAINGGKSFKKKNEKHVEIYLAFTGNDSESEWQA